LNLFYIVVMQQRRFHEKGFTIIEILAVLVIMGLVLGLSVPAITGLTKANQLANSARLVSNLCSIARSEAVTKRVKTCLAIVENWPSNTQANHRRMSIWRWDEQLMGWIQISKWEELPQGIAFHLNAENLANQYEATLDGHILGEQGTNEFIEDVSGADVIFRYAEFTPTGAVNMPGLGDKDLEIWMVLTQQAFANSGSLPDNYAKITTNVLTGRVKIERP
jgi:prepilin-type N-terminal cleavage/methylation domain-containing protein